jgi:hypothetical protein
MDYVETSASWGRFPLASDSEFRVYLRHISMQVSVHMSVLPGRQTPLGRQNMYAACAAYEVPEQADVPKQAYCLMVGTTPNSPN